MGFDRVIERRLWSAPNDVRGRRRWGEVFAVRAATLGRRGVRIGLPNSDLHMKPHRSGMAL
jgi:hypothetical protein